jgi:hypothetical protein
MQYMMNVQRELDNHTVLEVGYIGSCRKLESLRAFRSIPGATGTVLERRPSESAAFRKWMAAARPATTAWA